MNVLFIGDVFGSPGRWVLSEYLQKIKAELAVDICIVNGENSAGGIGITANLYKKLRKYGADIVTGGNHSFAHSSKDPDLVNCSELLRPLNYPPGNPGRGSLVFESESHGPIGVLNLAGRTFLHESLDCPFRAADKAVEQLKQKTSVIIVDIHAEASSEKGALAYYLDGRVSAVLGTHTHVQTADERILPGGTAFITDAGMTGPEDSIIGMEKEIIIRRFKHQVPLRMEPAKNNPMINGVLLDIDESTGKARSIERIFRRVEK